MDAIRVGVVGTGHLGSIHARIYSGLARARLTGICDINKDRASSLSKELQIPLSTEYKELVGKVDAVSIATPTTSHYEVAKYFLASGIHVLIEKPITNNLKEADELLRIAEENGLILQVGHVERFNAAIRAIEGLAREPRFIECHRLGPYKARGDDVGVVLDLMIHDIDIILGFVKSEVASIEAIGIGVLSEFEDIANARITFGDGTISNLTASRLTEEAKRKIRIFQRNAYISIDYTEQSASIYTKCGNEIVKKEIDIKKEEPLKAELTSFIRCVRNKERPLVSGKEARDALELALRITDTIRKKK